MSPTGIGLILFVIVLSGLLAYWGDVVGRRLGKKRLTFGRLRPRHTAAVMTALFGMLGAAIAIGSLLWLSEPVRVLIFEGDQLRTRIGQLQGKLGKAETDLSQRQDELQKTQKDVKSEQARVTAERAKLAIARKDVATLRSLTNSLKAQAGSVRNQLAAVRKQLSAIKPEYEKVKKGLASMTRQRNFVVSDYQKLLNKNQTLTIEIQDKETTVNKLKGDIDDLNSTIASLRQQLDENSRSARIELANLQKTLNDVSGELKTAQEEYDRINAMLRTLYATSVATRTQPLSVNRGEELSRLPVGPNLSRAEARNFVLAVIGDCVTVAEQQGAKPTGPDGKSATLYGRTDDSGQRILTVDEQIDLVTDEAAGKDWHQVLLATASYNAFRGEFVPLMIQVKPNPIVYRLGAVIAETRSDGQKSEEQIVAQLSEFLDQTLAPKAVKDGMIPAVGRSNPLGEVSPDDVLLLVRQIKSTGRVIRVQFLAAQETRAADALKLEFRLR